MLPKAPTEHWGTMAFMSTVADGTNAHMAVTIEEGVHMLEGTRFECHAWQTPINPSKILHIEDKEEWRKFDNANPSRKRSKGKRQQILTPKVFKDRYTVRQQWNMNGECWTWADASAGAIFDDVYQSFLHEHALSDDHASCNTTRLASTSEQGVALNVLGCYRCTRWHAKKLATTRKWSPMYNTLFAKYNVEQIDKMIKLPRGPANVFRQHLLLPLPTKRHLKMEPKDRLFLKAPKCRLLIEDEERAALRFNVLTKECEYFPGSCLACRPARPRSSLLGQRNTILRYAGLLLIRDPGKEVQRPYKSTAFKPSEAAAEMSGHVEPTILDPQRIRLNIPSNVKEAKACLIAHFACQYMPINQKPFELICEKAVIPNSDGEWKERPSFLVEVPEALQAPDKLLDNAPTYAQAEVYCVQRKLAEMIVPNEALSIIYGIASHDSDLGGSKKACVPKGTLSLGEPAPFQKPQTTAEGPSDASAPTTAARTAAASNQDDQDMVNGDASDVGEQGTK
jgi:hypothetical protein